MSGTPEKPNSGLAQCPGFLRENLKAYLDGELSPLRRGVVRWHIARCAHCREESVWLRRLGEDMRTLEKSTPNPRLRQRILASLPPPAPMRPPLKIWRPEPNFARFAPNFALGVVAVVFALGGAFAMTHSRQASPAKKAVAAPSAAPIAVPSIILKPTIAVVPQMKGDPFAIHAIPEDPTSRKANELSRESAHRLAMQRRREVEQAARQPALKLAATAPPPLTLAASPEIGDTAALTKRLEALTIQAGGTMKTTAVLPQGRAYAVVPGVPLEGKPRFAPAVPNNPGLAVTDGAEVALRIPKQQAGAFLSAMKALGTLKRLPLPKTAAKTDQNAARDTAPAENDGFVTFRVRLRPGQ